ncbi:MAG: hypothetical protein Q9159_006775 [Coniocarpon cinnabarinum]
MTSSSANEVRNSYYSKQDASNLQKLPEDVIRQVIRGDVNANTANDALHTVPRVGKPSDPKSTYERRALGLAEVSRFAQDEVRRAIESELSKFQSQHDALDTQLRDVLKRRKDAFRAGIKQSEMRQLDEEEETIRRRLEDKRRICNYSSQQPQNPHHTNHAAHAAQASTNTAQNAHAPSQGQPIQENLPEDVLRRIIRQDLVAHTIDDALTPSAPPGMPGRHISIFEQRAVDLAEVSQFARNEVRHAVDHEIQYWQPRHQHLNEALRNVRRQQIDASYDFSSSSAADGPAHLGRRRGVRPSYMAALMQEEGEIRSELERTGRIIRALFRTRYAVRERLEHPERLAPTSRLQPALVGLIA